MDTVQMGPDGVRYRGLRDSSPADVLSRATASLQKDREQSPSGPHNRGRDSTECSWNYE
jgi:hypothetical protein